MTNRYHLPVVITTADELSKEDATEYVERLLTDLEETETVHRVYVEDTSIDEGQAERLLDVLERADVATIGAACQTIEHLSSE